MTPSIDGIYLRNLNFKGNLKCFKGAYQISFTKPNNYVSKWTVILGNNNTGKTTILKMIASLEPQIKIAKNSEKYEPAQYITKELEENYSIRAILNQGDFPLFPWGFESLSKNFSDGMTVVVYDSVEDNNKKYFNVLSNSFFIAYGISRKISDTGLSNERDKKDNLKGVFQDDAKYTNPEEWLLQLDLAASKGDTTSTNLFNKVKEILTSDLLPDVQDIELISETKENTVQNYALFHTDYGKVRLRELGYGYQSTMVWVVDLAKKMFERFHKLENPLHGAAICLVDEIDLHLHPDWQRKIIKYLSGVFPNVQFIVTAHSPLIVQSAEDVNLIILEKDEENTHIRQEFGTFQGWTVEEILQDLMGLGEKTLSDTYLNFLKQFETGIDEENYEKAKSAFDELNKILRPTSSQRKLLKLQLGSIAPLPASTFA